MEHQKKLNLLNEARASKFAEKNRTLPMINQMQIII